MKRDRKKDTNPINVLLSHINTIYALRAEAGDAGISIEQLICVKIADWYNLHTTSKFSKIPSDIGELLEIQAALLESQVIIKTLNEFDNIPVRRSNKQNIHR